MWTFAIDGGERYARSLTARNNWNVGTKPIPYTLPYYQIKSPKSATPTSIYGKVPIYCIGTYLSDESEAKGKGLRYDSLNLIHDIASTIKFIPIHHPIHHLLTNPPAARYGPSHTAIPNSSRLPHPRKTVKHPSTPANGGKQSKTALKPRHARKLGVVS